MVLPSWPRTSRLLGLPCFQRMMKIKAQRIRDARAFTTYIGNSILIMENSDLGGCETLETPNIFLFPSVLSLLLFLFGVGLF